MGTLSRPLGYNQREGGQQQVESKPSHPHFFRVRVCAWNSFSDEAPHHTNPYLFHQSINPAGDIWITCSQPHVNRPQWHQSLGCGFIEVTHSWTCCLLSAHKGQYVFKFILSNNVIYSSCVVPYESCLYILKYTACLQPSLLPALQPLSCPLKENKGTDVCYSHARLWFMWFPDGL